MSNRLVRMGGGNGADGTVALDNFHDKRGLDFGPFHQVLNQFPTECERFAIARERHCAEIFRLWLYRVQRKAVSPHERYLTTARNCRLGIAARVVPKPKGVAV